MGSQKSQIRPSDWAQHSTFTIAKTRKQPKGPLTYSWIKKYHIYIFFPIYSAIKKKKKKKKKNGASLAVQWLRICLPMQGTWV